MHRTYIRSSGIPFCFCVHKQSHEKQGLYRPNITILEPYERVADTLGIEIEDIGLIWILRPQVINNGSFWTSDLWSSERDSNREHKIKVTEEDLIRGQRVRVAFVHISHELLLLEDINDTVQLVLCQLCVFFKGKEMNDRRVQNKHRPVLMQSALEAADVLDEHLVVVSSGFR